MYYIYASFFRTLFNNKIAVSISILFLSLLYLKPLILYFRKSGGSTFSDTLAKINDYAFAVALIIFFFTFLFDIISFVISLVQKRTANKRLLSHPQGILLQGDLGRRLFLKRILGMGVLTVTPGAILVAKTTVTPEIEHIILPDKNIPDELKKLRIVQLSDLHVGPMNKKAWLENIVKQVNSLKADIVVITGDLVDGTVSWLENDIAVLKNIKAPLGRFFVTGNHEYYSGAEPWIEYLKKIGFTVLNNNYKVLIHGTSSFVIAGVPDVSVTRFFPNEKSDPALALKGAPKDLYTIFLAHHPESAQKAVELGLCDLALCGHTHGGQFFPVTLVIGLIHKFSAGLYEYNNRYIYVNRGAGYWGPPVRIGVPAEITLFTFI